MNLPPSAPPGRIRARIDLGALRHNFGVARARCPGARTLAVIKANAYGHGLLEAAEALAEAELFGVTDFEEARRLAAADPGKPILILQGLMDRREIRPIAEAGFQLVVHSLEQLIELEQELDPVRLEQPLTVWLKMDSGMGRLGILQADYARAWQALKGKAWAAEPVMMTHLANSSMPGSELTVRQLQTFEALRRELRPELTSIPSSSGLLGGISSEWVRPGIMLYGSSPFPFHHAGLRAEALGLKPVMTLESKLIALKQLKAGDNVGYCSQFVCPKDMKVGIAAAGYADGYPSHAANGTPVLVDGWRSQTLGRVSMDMLALDLTHLPNVEPGAPVTLWGQGLPVDEIAAATGVISYNLLCSVSRRVAFQHQS